MSQYQKKSDGSLKWRIEMSKNIELSPERKQEMMDKVASCLSLATDQAGTPEGIAAMNMATKLMAKYRIAETMLDFGNKNQSEVFGNEVDGLNDQGGRRQWVLDLGQALCSTFNCKQYFSSYKGTITFIGTEADLVTVEMLFETVLNHINRGARAMWPKDQSWKKRNIFGTGAVQVVADRLYQIKCEMQKEFRAAYAGGTDLVVVKDALVAKEFEEATKHMHTAKRKNVNLSDRTTYIAGRINGESASLNQQIN